ncbi:alpha/beta hydrolase fold domain-containing protein [Nonomuraea rhizosphaerae]|uniref:alpha/beta hydrolase fold domain-containing protein n=1 Tax=Nonomuraea rhizosphaerae TaxID=2665663 RepID=UPI001C5E513B|nr:alpha/beta hydrolase fold domain-containing protein [Nonomuraea rhizosphaerae]
MPDHAAVRLVADTRLRGAAGPLPVRTYWPAATPAAPMLVFLPADGIEGADALCRAACSGAGVVVLSVSYRKPRRQDGRCDAILATEWAADHARELGADPDRLLLAGEGAGAELAAAVASHARERGWPPLAHLTIGELLDRPRRLSGFPRPE